MVGLVRVCTHCASVYIEEVEFCGIDGAPLIEQDEDPLLGKSLDRYMITELLGAGGMGRVYRARHQHFDREYAVKVLYGDLAANKGSVRRFQREAEATGGLDHANVVKVFDFGQSAEGLFFLVMERVHGRTLKDALAEDGPFSAERTHSVIQQVAAGLKAAHDTGIVHRDLKPANIMLVDQEGVEHVKIVDFGLAGLIEDNDALQSKLTSTGSTLGTPAYMAPEQALGSKVTRTADLYSLGVVLYEMLSGNLPFGKPSPDMLMKKMVSTPPPLEGAGPLQTVTAQLLIAVPERRPQSVDVLLAALDGEMPEPLAQPSLPVVPTEATALDSDSDSEVSSGSAEIPVKQRRSVWGLGAGVMGVGSVALWLAWPSPVAPVPVEPSPKPAVEVPAVPPVATPTPKPELRVETEVATAPKLELAPRSRVGPQPAKVEVVRRAPKPRRARPVRVTKAKPKALPSPKVEVRAETIAALDASLASALRKRGLTTVEMALLSGVSAPLQAWSRARESAPALEATAKLQILLLSVQAADIPLAMLEAKLDRIATGLERGASASPDTLRRLEDRYLDLSSRVGSRPAKRVRAELATALFGLERSVARL